MKRRTIAEYLLVALCAIVAALLVQAFLVKPYRIPSESMAATLVPRDRVLVNRVVYRLHAPGRGDIVVIDSAAVGRILIKRVVGAARRDDLRRRRRGVHRRPPPRRTLRPPAWTARPNPRSRSAAPAQAWSLERPYTVPSGHYFLMGDNRVVSDDSRDWGPAPRREIIGEAFLTYWPLSRLHGL